MLPAMEDRLGDLRRQRESVVGHLRWLDQEIARAAQTQSASAPPPASIPVIAPVPLRPQEAAPPADHRVLPELVMPEIDPSSIRSDVRRGCFIYVAIVSVLIAASLSLALWLAGL